MLHSLLITIPMVIAFSNNASFLILITESGIEGNRKINRNRNEKMIAQMRIEG